MFSQEWNWVALCGGLSTAVPGTPGPAPVMVKLRGDDHGPASRSRLTAWTRQKYVPGGRPLMMSVVVVAPDSSARFRSSTDAKPDVRLISQL